MKTIRILTGDPAKAGDAFGIVGLEGTYPDKKIYVRHARQFKRKSYNTIANYFFELNNKVKFNMMLLEKNFDYENLLKAFSKLDIKYVTTTGNLSEKNRPLGWAVDKPFMMNWMRNQYRLHNIQYPTGKKSDDIKELINQQNEMDGITAPSGHISYKRTRGRHDDLFMAKLIGCNVIRIWWEEQRLLDVK